LVLFFHSSHVSSAECNVNGCSNCTKSAGCGWCAATQTCMVGNQTGPEVGVCRGSWLNTCVDCSTQMTCISCSSNLDCAWCQTNVDPNHPTHACISVEEITANQSKCPLQAAHCPCNDFNTCHECSRVPGCVFCDTGSCSETLSGCTAVTCECHNYPTCTTCTDDPSCGWCYGTSNCTSLPAACSTSNCDHNCRFNLGCVDCVAERGCGWCPSLDACHTVDSTICGDDLQTACSKKCSTVPDCTLCIDMGLPCEWCVATKSCTDISFAGNCTTTDSCATEVCPEVETCGMCLKTPGCAWCSKKGGYCTDIFHDECEEDLAHTCSGVFSTAFSIGSFFGGMASMLAIYLLIGVCAYFYKKKNPPKHYQEMQ